MSPIISVISPEVTDKLIDLHDINAINWVDDTFNTDHTDRYDYVFITTDNRGGANAEALAHFKELNIPVNIADNPDECDFHMPAVIIDDESGGAMISISTDGGENPTKTKRIREKLEAWIASGGLEDL